MQEISLNQTNLLSDIHVCRICEKRYENANSLRTHIRRKHGMTYSLYCCNDLDVLSCFVCGLKSNNLNSHIIRTHKMTISDYLHQFPNADTCKLTDKQILKMTLTKQKQKTRNKETLEKKQKNRDSVMKEGGTPLKCRLCNFESYLSLVSHVIRKHKISINDYRALYTNDIIQRSSPLHVQRVIQTMKEKLSDESTKQKFLTTFRVPFPSQVEHWLRKGYSETEAKRAVSDFQKAQSLKATDHTRKILSEKNSGQLNKMSLNSLAIRHNVSIEEARKLTPCYGRRGVKHPMYGKKHTIEALKKIGEHINTSGRSRLEHAMSDQLVSILGGHKNVGVEGWCCDYVNHELKLIVEFFGDFWHHNPVIYDIEYVNPFTKRSSADVWERDRRKIHELSNLGYKVIVVWEHDWKLNSGKCIQEIINASN